MIFKRHISLILAAVMTFGTVNIAFADNDNNLSNVSYVQEDKVMTMDTRNISSTDIVYAVEGGNIYFDKNTGTITGADESITYANIPSTIGGVNVTSIGESAFTSCISLTSIDIPDSVTSIGKYGFCGCRSLTSITIPEGVTSIGEGMFWDCNSLASVDIPDSVTSIGLAAFEYCFSLKSINIPDSVTFIDLYAFRGCESLISVDIPDSVTTIRAYAFLHCDSLESVFLPNNLTMIESYVFQTCKSLTSIYIPESVKNIKIETFEFCDNLKDVYYGGNEEQWKAIDIWEDNECLLNATIHYNSKKPTTESTSISTTESTTLSTETTTVTETTTESTTESTTVTETTTESTTAVTESTTEPTTEPDYVISGSSIVVPVEGGNVYIDKDSGEVAGCDEGVTSVDIPSKVNGIEVKSISADAFKNCKDIKSITIPDTVTAIAENAFADCISLIEIHCTKGSFADNKALYSENTEIKYTYLYGDADGNNKLEASDAAMVLQKVLKSSFKMTIEETVTDYMYIVDVDRNGELNAADAAMILQKVLKSSFKMTCEI